MPDIVTLGDQPILVPVSAFPAYAKFPFENFNPVQSRIFEIYNKDCNALIAAATSAGKTVCAEMFMSHEVRERGGKAVYLAPLKALAQEKIDDWTDPEHHFNDQHVSICTGDYRLTPERKKELEDANVIVFSTEMLNSRCRNFKSENNEFLKQIGTLIVDESHLLTVPGRGDHLEVGLMKLAQIAPNARIICLSATMPNVDEIAEWIGKLNGKATFLLQSTYRPCPLGIHYEQYFPESLYEENEKVKVQTAMQILEDNPDDKFIFFAHTKRTGELMKKALNDSGFEAEFHNADLTKDKRKSLESRFRKGKLQCVVATSTLAWGLNMPARRVVILGMHRGMTDVATYDIWQMAGRAGRVGYDPRGDVYILLPDHKAVEYIERLKNPDPIISRLLDYVGQKEPHYKTLAFHLISEIHHKNIRTRAEIHKWYSRTLAHHEAHKLDEGIVDSTLDLLVKCGAARIEEDGTYSATTVGMISSMFYFSPFDVSDLKHNFRRLFTSGHENNDILLSISLGDVDSIRGGIVSKGERADMANYKKKIEDLFGEGQFTDPAIKGGYAYFTLLTGMANEDHVKPIAATARTLQWDFPRLVQVLHAVDNMSAKWKRQKYLDTVQMRVAYGVKSELIPLVRIAEVGKARAERLWAAGIKTPADVVKNASSLPTILKVGPDKAVKIREAALALSQS